MKKNLVMFEVVTLIICVCLLGCMDGSNSTDDSSKNKDYSFVGTWTGETVKSEKLVIQNVTYFSDGRFTNDIFGNGTYEINNNTIVMVYEKTGKNTTYDYSFSDNDNILTLKIVGSENTEVLTKIK